MRRTLNPNTAAIGAAVLGAVLIALLFFREQVGHRLFPCCEISRERNLLFAPFGHKISHKMTFYHHKFA